MIESLINKVAQLPGFGPKSAKRAVLYMLNNKDGMMHPLIQEMQIVVDSSLHCDICGNIDVVSPCAICADTARDDEMLCIVKNVADLWAFEGSVVYKGKYHVVHNLTQSSGEVERLQRRVKGSVIKEMIIAIGSTLEDRITTHYINDMFGKSGITITTLACGIPVGGEIDYMDEGTLNIAINSRTRV